MKIVLENNCWRSWDWQHGSIDFFSIRWFTRKSGKENLLGFKYISISILGIEFSIIWGMKKKARK